MASKGIDSGTGLSWDLAKFQSEEEFPDSIDKYDVERTDSRIFFEKDEESQIPYVGSDYQCLHCVAKPVLYEKLKVKVTTSAGRYFEKDMVFSTHFKRDILSENHEKEIEELPFDRFSKTTVESSDFYLMRNDILKKLKTRDGGSQIDDCYSVKQKHLSELFPEN